MNKYDPTCLIRPTPYGLLVAILSGFNSFHSIKSSGKKNICLEPVKSANEFEERCYGSGGGGGSEGGAQALNS